MVGPMGPRIALAWLLTLLLCSLAAVLVYTALREPPPPEVRPIKVDRGRPAGGHGEDSGDRTRHPGRGPTTELRGGGGRVPDPDDGRNGRSGVPDPDDDGGLGDGPDPADDAGGGGRAADPGDAPDHVLDRDGRGHRDDPPDDGGGDGERGAEESE